jgi:CBS domain-containing protein
MKVSDVMTKNAACVRSHEPLSVAAQIMWECDCGAVPVVDDTGERLIGILTDRDICMAVWSKDRVPAAIPVHEVMTRDVVRCGPNDSVTSAESLMREKQIRRLPVTSEEGRLLGILSLADIVRRGRSGVTPGNAELSPSEIAATLAGIVEKRANGQVHNSA